MPLPLDAAPARWPTVVRFGYGGGPAELGYLAQTGLNPLLPAAAVVSASGLWVADPVKGRIAHYSLAGRYLGQATGLSQVASDLAAAPSGQLVVIDDGAGGTLRSLAPGSRQLSAPIQVTLGEAPGSDTLNRLIPTDSALGLWAAGEHPLAASFHMDKSREGVPDGSRVFDVAVHGSTVHIADAPAWSRDLEFHAPKASALIVEVDAVQIHGGRVFMWLLAADDSAGGTHQRGGEFFLELDSSGAVVAIEKVAAPPSDVDVNVARKLVVAPDGTVFQFYADAHHAELRRRP